MIQNLPILIPISLILFAFLSAFLGVMRFRLSQSVALLGALISLVMAVFGLNHVLQEGAISYHLGGWPPPEGIEFVLDHLSAFMVLVITLVGFILLIFPTRPGFLMDEQRGVPLYAMVLMLIAGLCGVVLSGDLFNLYVFLEIASLSTYALVSLGSGRAAFSSFRYLIMATIGGSFYLLGVGFIYFSVGTLNMADILQHLPAVYDSPAVIGGAVLIVAGIALKMALFPLHTWLPDAHSYAPPIVAAFLAAVQIEVSAYVIIRFLLDVFTPELMTATVPLTTVIGWASAAGIIVASVIAIAQTDFKRMLAYSTVGQVAYIGLGIGLANPLGIVGALLHIMAHALMKSCLFLIAGGVYHKTGIKNINDYKGLGRRMPWTMAAFTVSALAMIGIPPTAGFFSKWYLLLGSFDQSNWVFVGVILGSSLLNAVYFFRLIEKVFAPSEDKVEKGADSRGELSWRMLLPIILFAAGILVVGALNVFIVDRFLMPIVAGF